MRNIEKGQEGGGSSRESTRGKQNNIGTYESGWKKVKRVNEKTKQVTGKVTAGED